MTARSKTRKKKTLPARRSNCAVACTLDLVGDRWTLLVVRDLLSGKQYFQEFLRSPERIATNILAARLGALQEHGFIEQVPDPSDQRRHAYRFTEKGLHLRELLGSVASWGRKHLPGTKILGGFNLPEK
jgi:DNA-binding HxlR family transcriptional regulator